MVDVGPVGSVSGDVSVVVPVNDVVEPMPPDVFTAVPVVAMIPPEGFADTPDPVAPGVVVLVEPGDVGIEELTGPGDDGLLPGVDMVELIELEKGDVGAVGGESVEITLPPSTDPVGTLVTGPQGADIVLGRPGV